MAYVITCGDEGVQINVGTRLGVVGAGYDLEGFSEVAAQLKKLLGDDLRIAASSQNQWVKDKLDLDTWNQVDASSQQHTEALADKEGLMYCGILPFADPEELKHDIKGHMVRPRGIHIATKITFTLDGGEQKYHLGQNLISAEWVSGVDFELAKKIMAAQVAHYKTLAKDTELEFTVQHGGDLGEEVAAKNKAVLEKMGYEFPVEEEKPA
jgi:hypothetical protein